MDLFALIKEFPYTEKALQDVCEIVRGESINKADVSDSGMYPVYSGGTTPMGYIDKSNRKAGATIIVTQGSAGSVLWSPTDFWQSGFNVALYPNHDELTDECLFFILSSRERLLKQKMRPSMIPSLDIDTIRNFKIRYPNLEVQRVLIPILSEYKQHNDEFCDTAEELQKVKLSVFEAAREFLFGKLQPLEVNPHADSKR